MTRKMLNCALALAFLCFGPTMAQADGSGCGQDLLSLSQDLSYMPPIGLSKEGFLNILEAFERDPELRKAEALALYGSRTHFTYGYGPEKGSDLDVMPFFDESASKLEVLNTWSALKPVFQKLSQTESFPIKFDIPNLRSLWDTLTSSTTTVMQYVYRSKTAEKAAFDEVMRIASDQKLKRAEVKKLWIDRGGGGITHEALIILRSNENTAFYKARLIELGYTNILIVP